MIWWSSAVGIKQHTLKSEELPSVYINTKWTTGEKSIKLICDQLCFDY